MRRAAVSAAAVLLAAGAASGQGREKLRVDISEGAWSSLAPYVQAVAVSAGNSIYEHCGNTSVSPILLFQDRKLCMREAHDDNGRVPVSITVTDTHWDWVAEQFAHMFVHVLAGHSLPFSDPVAGKSDENMWFEESLGEIGAMFALTRMAEIWQTSPPYWNWKDYAGWLGTYGSFKFSAGDKNKPASFPEWFQTNYPAMRQDPFLRHQNAIVAYRLYPLFKEEPAGWEAVCYLRRSRAAPNESFEAYLQRWHAACPANLQPFVKKIRACFVPVAADPAAKTGSSALTPSSRLSKDREPSRLKNVREKTTDEPADKKSDVKKTTQK